MSKPATYPPKCIVFKTFWGGGGYAYRPVGRPFTGSSSCNPALSKSCYTVRKELAHKLNLGKIFFFNKCCFNGPTLNQHCFDVYPRKINIMDNLLHKMETYANNLEEIVYQRTLDLISEKKRTDTLLYRMLPR